MTDDYPLTMLEHRISALRDRLAAASREGDGLTGDAHAAHAARVADLARELDELEKERDILAADAR
jgi:hypothetical protein